MLRPIQSHREFDRRATVRRRRNCARGNFHQTFSLQLAQGRRAARQPLGNCRGRRPFGGLQHMVNALLQRRARKIDARCFGGGSRGRN